MEIPYLFILARTPQELPDLADRILLEKLQGVSLATGFCLRIHRCPIDWQSDIETLVEQGEAVAEGNNPIASEEGSLLCCDAIIPDFQSDRHWLGVYRSYANKWKLLDNFSLYEAKNEPCWFYPTENGTYLSWHSKLQLTTKPGIIAEPDLLDDGEEYSRENVQLLWSLMADDKEMTAVGITYKNLRIDWGLIRCKPEIFSTWSSFSVNDMESKPLEMISTICTTRKINTSARASH